MARSHSTLFFQSLNILRVVEFVRMLMTAVLVGTLAIVANSFAADRSECAGYGGSKICRIVDINPPQGMNYGPTMNDYTACDKMEGLNAIGNDGFKTYELVAEPPVGVIGGMVTSLENASIVNYCPWKRSGLFTAHASCSRGTLSEGTPLLCIPADISEDKHLGDTCPQCGNPINYAYGNKFQKEVDYAGPNRLSFVRYYNSSNLVSAAASLPGNIGRNWRHSFRYVIGVSTVTTSVVQVYRPDGRAFAFINPDISSPAGQWIPDADVNDRLTRLTAPDGLPAGWEYYDAAQDAIEKYGVDGQVTRINYRSGEYLDFIYGV
jgi:hypothetical protein